MIRNRTDNLNTSFPPNLLGAHRYTIYDGTCALPRVSCGGRCPWCPCATGEARLPLRRVEKRLPHSAPSSQNSHRSRAYNAVMALRAAERRLRDAEVSEHANIRRQQRRK